MPTFTLVIYTGVGNYGAICIIKKLEIYLVAVIIFCLSQIEDLFRYNASRSDLCLVYILTLGVVDDYRCLGVG